MPFEYVPMRRSAASVSPTQPMTVRGTMAPMLDRPEPLSVRAASATCRGDPKAKRGRAEGPPSFAVDSDADQVPLAASTFSCFGEIVVSVSSLSVAL